MVRDRLLSRLDTKDVKAIVERVEAAVLADEMTPDQAATEIVRSLDGTR